MRAKVGEITMANELLREQAEEGSRMAGEDNLHWQRDVCFGEDRATTRTAPAPRALTAFCEQ